MQPGAAEALAASFPALRDEILGRRVFGSGAAEGVAREQRGALSQASLEAVASAVARSLEEVLAKIQRLHRRLSRVRLGSGFFSMLGGAGVLAPLSAWATSVSGVVVILASALNLFATYFEDQSGGDGSVSRLREAAMEQVGALAEIRGKITLGLLTREDVSVIAEMTALNAIAAKLQTVRARLGLPLAASIGAAVAAIALPGLSHQRATTVGEGPERLARRDRVHQVMRDPTAPWLSDGCLRPGTGTSRGSPARPGGYASRRTAGRSIVVRFICSTTARRPACLPPRRPQIGKRRRIDAGMVSSACVRPCGRRTVGRTPACLVQVPVEGFGQQQALGQLEPERVDVGDLHEQGGDLHSAPHAELAGLLDRVDGVGPRVGERQHLGSGQFRLQSSGDRSAVPSGCRTEPSTRPPPARKASAASRSSAWPSA